MIDLCRRQLDFGDGLIAEEVGDLWEDWMRHVDTVLEDPALLDVVYEALACRWKNSRTRGRKGTPVDVEQGKQRMWQCYRRLMAIAGRVVGQAKGFVREVADGIKRARRRHDQAGIAGYCRYLESMIPRVQQVLRQTRERIDKGNVHASGKIVSLFEPDTEVIRKGKAGKPTEFGKMVKIQEAEQQIVTHYEVYDQRPSDSDLLAPSLEVEVHERQFGHAPRLGTADAGFFSARNEANAHERGVRRVAIPHLGTKNMERRAVQKKRWFRNAQKWRTGCEGRISLLKSAATA